MYTGHFGLDDGPFHGKAEGEEVYIGPQQAAVLARLRKVLAIADTAVTVSGPVGVGKTTLVRRALADLAGSKNVITVDRMRLQPDEVLDLLLSRFDFSRQPKGTIQRVAAFRRLLHDRLANDTRIFIVVEDAERVGVDALLEIEALTATDSGEPVGANIVLMGGGGLPALLAQPALARLRQRIRLRQAVAPFDEVEVEGYMRHCLECASGVLEQIFEPGTPRVVYRYSAGIARVVDNLCESALVAAAEAGLATILPEFLQEVAENCGLEAQTEEGDAAVGEPVPRPLRVEDATGQGVGTEKEVESGSFGQPVPLVAPLKLALVESWPRAADEALAEAVEDPQVLPAAQPETDGESDLPPPVSDEAREYAGEAEAGPHAGEGAMRDSSVTVSRIDEVLPELVERLRLHARSRAGTTGDAAHRVERSSGDSIEIPTLSSSMRVALLSVRSMDERPRAVEDADEEDAPAEADEPLSTDERPMECGTSEAGTAPQESAGIVPSLAEPSPTVVPQAESAFGEIMESWPIDATAGVAQPGVPAHEAGEPEVPAEAAAGPERLVHEPQIAEASPEASEGQDRPFAESPEIEATPALAEEASLEEATDLEQSSASESASMAPAALAADESGDDATTEAVTLSLDEELALSPDVATDVFVADEKHAFDGEEPELDALQAAIRAANAWQASEADGDACAALQAPPQSAASDLPEITLDLELEKHKPPASDLDRWADEISKAKSLEDISDILAETIFGNEEVEAISAGIRAKKAVEGAAGPGATLPSSGAALPKPGATAPRSGAALPKPGATAPKPGAAPPRPGAAPQKPAPRGLPPAAAHTQRPSVPHRATGAASSRPQAKPPARPAAGPAINMTMSQRIEMVNSLNGRRPMKPVPGMQVAEIVLAGQPDEPVPSLVNGPRSIEAQIDTAITQSRKILSEADLARLASPGVDGDDKGKRGLFGLFRRSKT